MNLGSFILEDCLALSNSAYQVESEKDARALATGKGLDVCSVQMGRSTEAGGAQGTGALDAFNIAFTTAVATADQPRRSMGQKQGRIPMHRRGTCLEAHSQ